MEAARGLTNLGRRPTESDLKRELRASLESRLGALTMRDAEGEVDLKGWPGVGRVDLVIDASDGDPSFVELKFGAGTLYNCAWDATKLALSLGEGATRNAYMVAGAPLSDWSASVLGSEFFGGETGAPEMVEWETAQVLERYESEFAFWREDLKTRPRRLPNRFDTTCFISAPMTIEDEPWELRWSAIDLTRTDGWIEIDENGVMSPAPSDLPRPKRQWE